MKFRSNILGFVGLLQKVALDQLVFSPIFLGVFFTYNGIMEGQGWPGVKRKFKQVNTLIPCESLFIALRII